MVEEKSNENLDVGIEYGNKSEFSKPRTCMEQIGLCKINRSKEMREGYYNRDRFGNKIYIPDTRKEFISSVIALKNLMSPEIAKDTSAKEKVEEIAGKEKKAIETFGVYPVETFGNRILVKTKEDKYIPYLGETFPITRMQMKHGQQTLKCIEYISGIHDRKHHDYWNYLITLYDGLFAELNDLLERVSYFEGTINY